MGIYNKVYIGHVETVNLDAYNKDSLVESKVVVLKRTGFDKVNELPTYRPLRKYSEYYKLVSVQALNGFVSDNKINKALRDTGKKEVKQLSKIA